MEDGVRQDMIFLGVKSSIAHASVHWWEASRERAEPGESVIDVFGVRRQRRAVAAPPAGLAAGGLWKTLRPRELSDAHTAPGTRALICSGLDDSHRQMALEAARAGKSVFVESLEQFSQADVAELVASTTSSTQTLITASGAEERAPAAYFMAGLHLRFDRGVWQAASGPGGIQERVGRPVLYQAHASIVEGSLFDLGMVHVDGLRLLLGAEPTEVHCMGIHGTQVETPAAPAATPAAPTEPGSQTTEAAQPPPAGRLQQWFTGAMDTMNASGPAGASELGVCSAVTLSLRMSTGALATISLDRVGGSAMQTVLVVGELAKAEFRVAPAGGLGREEDLQKAGVNHFVETVLSSSPTPHPRITGADCLRAFAIMTAAAKSLHTGRPVVVSYGGLEVLAGRTAAAVGGAAHRAAAAVGGVVERVGEALAAVPAKVSEAASGLGAAVSSPTHALRAGVGAGPGTLSEPQAGLLGAKEGAAEEEGQGVGTPPHSTTKGQAGQGRKFTILLSPDGPALRELGAASPDGGEFGAATPDGGEHL